MGCKNCMEECIGKTPCEKCKKIGMKVLLIPIVAFVICYFIGIGVAI